MKHFLALLLAPAVVFSVAAPVPPAKADEILVQNDGAVILVITNDQVLAESTTKKEESKPKPAQTVTLAPSNAQSVVKINPKTTGDKKIEVTVSVGVPVKKAGTIIPAAAPNPAPAAAGSNITKKVDQVVAEGVNGKSVLTIKPNNSGQITISQENTDVSTALPIQIDTVTHTLSNETSKILVLPKEAAQGANNQIKSEVSQISLTGSANGPVYNVSGNEKGKLLGLLPVQSITRVTLSAQTGRVIQASQSPLFGVFGFLIK